MLDDKIAQPRCYSKQSHLPLLEQPLVGPEPGVRAGQLVLLVGERLVQLDGEPDTPTNQLMLRIIIISY